LKGNPRSIWGSECSEDAGKETVIKENISKTQMECGYPWDSPGV
jgi:hypothetical protein